MRILNLSPSSFRFIISFLNTTHLWDTILFVYCLQRNTSLPGLVHQVSPSNLSWSSAGLAVIQKGSSHEYKQRNSRAIRVIWSEITQVSMHEEQSKYEVCGVKYWNYDELSLAIQNLPTGVQELTSLSDISATNTNTKHFGSFTLLGDRKRCKSRCFSGLLDLTAHDGKGENTLHMPGLILLKNSSAPHKRNNTTGICVLRPGKTGC